MAEKVTLNNFIVVQGWMLQMDLKNWNEVAAFALVYGFSQDNESRFQGSISYIQEWLMCSRPTAISIMKSLEDKQYVIKIQETINGVTFNRYKANLGVVKNFYYQLKNLTTGSKEILPNNNKDNNIIIVEEAHTHTREGVFGEQGGVYQVLLWVTDNEDGLQQMLHRNQLIFGLTPMHDMIEIIKPYVQEYYEQQLMSGGDDITRRGRRDIKQHFSQWLPKHIKKKQQEQQQRQQEYEQTIDPVSRAMQDFAAGWDNAERRKQQE